MARDLPYLVIKWLVFYQVRNLLAVGVATSWMANAKNALAGGIAGALAATAVTPADVVKTRLQAQRSSRPSGTLSSPLEVGKELVAEGGFRALFKGIVPRLARIPLYTAVTLATFELIKAMFVAGA